MCKDRVRSVGWSKYRSSPHHAVLTTARVGPYYHIRTIYIRRYGHRPTTLILYTSHQTPESPKGVKPPTHHFTTEPLYHRATLPPSHRLIRPLIQRATPTITTFGTSQYWQPPAHHLPSNCVCEFTIMPSSKW